MSHRNDFIPGPIVWTPAEQVQPLPQQLRQWAIGQAVALASLDGDGRIEQVIKTAKGIEAFVLGAPAETAKDAA